MLLAVAMAVAGVVIGCGGAPAAPSPTPTVPGVTVPAPVPVGDSALASISLSVSSVAGGTSLMGTAHLTGVAPTGGALVALSGGDPVTVPSSVTVPSGSTSATFFVSTRTVGGTIVAKIGGSYGGTSASADLSVTQPTSATANFGVSGPTESETCAMIEGGTTLNCTFDGSSSTAPGTIVAWDWSYTVANTLSQTTTSARLVNPGVSCAWLPAPPFGPGASWFTISVTLRIHDSLGNTAEATNNNVRLFPRDTCGF